MRLAIAGAGGYGEVFYYYLSQQIEFEVVCFTDDDLSKHGTRMCGVPVIGRLRDWSALRAEKVEGVIAPIGNNKIRCETLAAVRANGFATPNFVHESAVVDSEIRTNSGVYILPGALVMPHVEIGTFVILSMGSRVAHHCRLSEGVFVSTGVNVGALISMGARAFAGIGSTIMTGVKCIGEGAVIGAGAVVVRDVQPHTTVVGVPARPIS